MDDYLSILVGDEFGEEVLIKNITKLPVKYISMITSANITIQDVFEVVSAGLKDKEQMSLIEELDADGFQYFVGRWVESSIG
jgi:hypothetical protein